MNLPADLLSSASGSATAAAIQLATAGGSALDSVMRTATRGTLLTTAQSGVQAIAANPELRATASTTAAQNVVNQSSGGQTSVSRATRVGAIGGNVQNSQSKADVGDIGVRTGTYYSGR
ncbi:hypothetical protein Rsub_01508 [Raphidocelis subcapitata]|uniref:Uncharacterized protein n=1 Tax=Raphidocelis subcapitata TaxID=307507 RepID=A0A2V0NP19_9CHLO|nr:hypothetical protein Rsub_01508 [Raphidocelis subcapitata]|eukprot:GBF89009.1 hypothetical protein Rsub_01508 [Raphidocelis subcapitata]